jgi:pantetheine-phosphate adenylyltransferase
MKSIIYPLSADPITHGHINIIERVLKTFDHVIVGIGINPKKKYTFTLEEREYLTKKALKIYGDRVTVKSYSGLLSDFAYENQVSAIVRGARNTLDFDFEKMLSDINQSFRMGLESYLLVADQAMSHISSSTAKELQENMSETIIDYVPLIVKEALELKISGQYRIGVTGQIGSGKSYVSSYLVKNSRESYERQSPELQKSHIHINSIDMDEVGRYILKESIEPIHMNIRATIANKFGQDLLIDNGKIDIRKLLKFLFNGTEASSLRTDFETIMAEPTMHIVRKKLRDLKGIVLINSALFVEQSICDLVNNNFLFITCPEDVRKDRLRKRGYSDLDIANRLSAQLPEETKLASIKELICEQSCGGILEFNNVDNSDILSLYFDIKSLYGGKI